MRDIIAESYPSMYHHPFSKPSSLNGRLNETKNGGTKTRHDINDRSWINQQCPFGKNRGAGDGYIYHHLPVFTWASFNQASLLIRQPLVGSWDIKVCTEKNSPWIAANMQPKLFLCLFAKCQFSGEYHLIHSGCIEISIAIYVSHIMWV